ncbi:unnamed protein product, partial [Rhizoctonia solani]
RTEDLLTRLQHTLASTNTSFFAHNTDRALISSDYLYLSPKYQFASTKLALPTIILKLPRTGQRQPVQNHCEPNSWQSVNIPFGSVNPYSRPSLRSKISGAQSKNKMNQAPESYIASVSELGRSCRRTRDDLTYSYHFDIINTEL